MTAKAALTELSYAQSSLSIDLRADGRARLDYRPFQVSTGVTPQANGSALVKAAGGATQILAGIKLEVCSGADLSAGESQIVFSVECTPAAAENLPKDPSGPLTEWLATVFYPALASHPQLVILPPPQTKLWRVYVDLIILSAGPQSGLLYDSVTLAARAALWDLKIPKTRGVAFQSKSKPTSTQQQAGGQPTGGGMDVDQTEMLGMKGLLRSGRAGTKAAAGSEVDFELESYWDEGAPLKNREHLPVAITLHLSGKNVFLDATTAESLAAPSRVVLAFNGQGNMVALRQDSEMEIEFSRVNDLLDHAGEFASQSLRSTNEMLRDPQTYRPPL